MEIQTKSVIFPISEVRSWSITNWFNVPFSFISSTICIISFSFSCPATSNILVAFLHFSFSGPSGFMNGDFDVVRKFMADKHWNPYFANNVKYFSTERKVLDNFSAMSGCIWVNQIDSFIVDGRAVVIKSTPFCLRIRFVWSSVFSKTGKSVPFQSLSRWCSTWN